MACPANTVSPNRSNDITDCRCDLGFTGNDGTACLACELGTYKNMNGSSLCEVCASGSYLNVTAGSVCVGCPANTVSPEKSDDNTDCICDLGFTGSDGTACRACDVGTYKGVNGSSLCEVCVSGSYLNVTAGTVCVTCPANTVSLTRSDDIMDCVCDLGYTGSDGTSCRACEVGTYKGVNGSGTCSDCQAGTYLNYTKGTVCLACPTHQSSPVGSDAITDCVCNIGYE
eukprot:1892582-Rhodomonas_salina.1